MRHTSDRLSRAISNSSGPPDLGSTGTPELFVYGTVAVDPVVEILVDRMPKSTEVSAPGWRAAQLPELPYPGLVVDSNASALGRVYSNLSEQEWVVLDAFEDPTYIVEGRRIAIRRKAHWNTFGPTRPFWTRKTPRLST